VWKIKHTAFECAFHTKAKFADHRSRNNIEIEAFACDVKEKQQRAASVTLQEIDGLDPKTL